MTWGIWCEVWGGVTGSRTAWLKTNDKIVEYNTREEAEAEAEHCNKKARDNPRASFRYSAARF